MNIVTLGNAELLKLEKVGFLSSRKVPPSAVLQCYDWAGRMRDAGVCVMGGFQSPLEKDVLKLLLKGEQPVILVLGRKMWAEKYVPEEFRKHIDAGRMLVVSPVTQTISRIDVQSAAMRNRYIIENSDTMVFATLCPGGELERTLNGFPCKNYMVLADVRQEV